MVSSTRPTRKAKVAGEEKRRALLLGARKVGVGSGKRKPRVRVVVPKRPPPGAKRKNAKRALKAEKKAAVSVVHRRTSRKVENKVEKEEKTRNATKNNKKKEEGKEEKKKRSAAKMDKSSKEANNAAPESKGGKKEEIVVKGWRSVGWSVVGNELGAAPPISVFRVVHADGRKGVIKFCPLSQKGSTRVTHEGLLLKSLQRKHAVRGIPHVLDFWQDHADWKEFKDAYFVMDDVGHPFAERTRLAPQEVARIAVSLLTTLQHVHCEHMHQHGDVKPSNVLQREDGAVMLIDFDVAQPLHQGRPSGCSPNWASVEQIQGRQPSARNDLDALGQALVGFSRGEHDNIWQTKDPKALEKEKAGWWGMPEWSDRAKHIRIPNELSQRLQQYFELVAELPGFGIPSPEDYDKLRNIWQ